jgi:hypothetical protein
LLNGLDVIGFATINEANPMNRDVYVEVDDFLLCVVLRRSHLFLGYHARHNVGLCAVNEAVSHFEHATLFVVVAKVQQDDVAYLGHNS